MATFGKTDVGGTQANNTADYIRDSIYTLAENGQVTDIRVWLSAAVGNVKMAIYDAALNKMWADDVGQAVVANWNTKAGLTVNLLAGNYWLCWKTSAGGTDYAYSAGGANQASYTSHAYANAYPAVLTQDGFQARAYSIYCTYTPAAAAGGVGGGQGFARELTLTLRKPFTQRFPLFKGRLIT